MWIDTTKLPDIDQRAEPLELIGQVFGTAGTAPYIHLQLEMSRRMFGDSMPTLVCNDGDDDQAEQVGKIASQYGADFECWPKLGHSPGDIGVFRKSMDWASNKGLDIVAKFSRRSIPLVSWRHGLQFLAASNTDVGLFTRRHLDTPNGLFRTDAIAYRVRSLKTPRVTAAFDEVIDTKYRPNVEAMFDSFSNVCGGWAMWDLLGPNFYKPWNKMMQWRGLLPYHYGDLSRALDLPYSDIHFLEASFGSVRIDALPQRPSSELSMKVIQRDGGKPLAPDAPPADTGL